VRIALYGDGLWAGGPGFDSRHGEIFLFSTGSWPILAPTQTRIQRVPVAISPERKRPGRDADHSPPSSTEVKNSRAIPPLSHTSSWHVWVTRDIVWFVFVFREHNREYAVVWDDKCNAVSCWTYFPLYCLSTVSASPVSVLEAELHVHPLQNSYLLLQLCYVSLFLLQNMTHEMLLHLPTMSICRKHYQNITKG
jgi:hypothetical protein